MKSWNVAIPGTPNLLRYFLTLPSWAIASCLSSFFRSTIRPLRTGRAMTVAALTDQKFSMLMPLKTRRQNKWFPKLTPVANGQGASRQRFPKPEIFGRPSQRIKITCNGFQRHSFATPKVYLELSYAFAVVFLLLCYASHMDFCGFLYFSYGICIWGADLDNPPLNAKLV